MNEKMYCRVISYWFLIEFICYKDIVHYSFLYNNSFASFYWCGVMFQLHVYKHRSYREAENGCLTSRTFISNCSLIRISVSFFFQCVLCFLSWPS